MDKKGCQSIQLDMLHVTLVTCVKQPYIMYPFSQSQLYKSKISNTDLCVNMRYYNFVNFETQLLSENHDWEVQ